METTLPKENKSQAVNCPKKILAKSNLFLDDSSGLDSSFDGTIEGKIVSCPQKPDKLHWIVEWSSTTTSNNEIISPKCLCNKIANDPSGQNKKLLLNAASAYQQSIHHNTTNTTTSMYDQTTVNTNAANEAPTTNLTTTESNAVANVNTAHSIVNDHSNAPPSTNTNTPTNTNTTNAVPISNLTTTAINL
jgi:hypothetical protein